MSNLQQNFWITDYGLGKSMDRVAKEASKAEKVALKAGAKVVKESIIQAVTAKGFKVNSKSSYNDRLVDAIRIGHINKQGKIIVHAWGTRKSGSGTFRLRFFESSKNRYQKTFKGKRLQNKRYVGNLSKYNGWFKSGFNASQGKVMPAMENALEKYIKRVWENG